MSTTKTTTTSDLLDQLTQHVAEIIKERDGLRVERETLRKVAHAAIHAVRSYQYGNSSPDLADEFVAFAAKTLNDTMPDNQQRSTSE